MIFALNIGLSKYRPTRIDIDLSQIGFVVNAASVVSYVKTTSVGQMSHLQER